MPPFHFALAVPAILVNSQRGLTHTHAHPLANARTHTCLPAYPQTFGYVGIFLLLFSPRADMIVVFDVEYWRTAGKVRGL